MSTPLQRLLIQAQTYYQRGDFDQALPHLEHMVETYPDCEGAYNLLGLVYHQRGQFAKAQTAFQQALALNKHDTPAALNLTVLYNDMGHYLQAQEVYSQALQTCQAYGDGWDPFAAKQLACMHANLARAYAHVGKVAEAEAEYQKALKLCPTHMDLYQSLAHVLMKDHRWTAAQKQLEQALARCPEDAATRVQLGVCCYAMGCPEEALALWDQVLSKHPDDPKAAMYKKMVQNIAVSS